MIPGRTRCLLALGASLCLILVAGCGGDGEGDGTAPVAPQGAPGAPSVTNVTVVTNTPAPANATGSAAVANGTATNPPATNAAPTNAAGEPAAAKKTEPPVKVGKNPIVAIETSLGTIKVQLDSAKAPVSTKNFVEYVQAGHYDGTVFHRVISDFMIQGGGFTADKTEKETRAPIKNEAGNGLKNKRGTIAMARTPDPNSASAQFYINVVDNDHRLDRATAGDGYGYTVFGKVIAGMDVVDRIKNVETAPQGGAFANAPVEPVVIKSAKIQKQ